MSQYTAEQVGRIANKLRYSGTDEFSEEAADVMDAYAATLRQQAGRVDEVTGAQAHVRRLGLADCRQGSRAIGHDGPENDRWEDYIEVPLERLAALAQNTQGEAEGVAEIYDALPHCNERTTFTFSRDKLQALLRHAERARVPDADVIGDAIEVVMEVRQFMESAKRFDAMERMQKLAIDLEQLLAAAPSQPKDADHAR